MMTLTKQLFLYVTMLFSRTQNDSNYVEAVRLIPNRIHGVHAAANTAVDFAGDIYF